MATKARTQEAVPAVEIWKSVYDFKASVGLAPRALESLMLRPLGIGVVHVVRDSLA